MFGIAIGTKSFDVYIEFSVHSHFKLLGLTENEKIEAYSVHILFNYQNLYQ